MKGGDKKSSNPMGELKKIEAKREERRQKMEEAKRQREEKKAYNLASGKNVDIDFEIMIDKNRFQEKLLSPHISSANMSLAVCVRKRPIFKKQEQNGEIDSISCANPQIKVHEPRFKVDGITKYVENHTFTFDNTFNETEETSHIYECALKPTLPLLVQNGIVTCFAYGQTGSGKTFTMNQLQTQTVMELFKISKKQTVSVSIFQIYAGRCLDLLNDKAVLSIMEDKSSNIQIQGLVEKNTPTADELLQVMEQANAARTTHATAANDTSSRSHAICQIFVRRAGSDVGKLVLVDLAGSERAQDTQSNNKQRRMQGAEINKSLLALKECIRAMGDKAEHVPFRASKLTLILRDSFTAKQEKAKVIMIACISPGSSSADHSLNTLRYADRLKENSEMHRHFNEIYQNKRNDSFDVQKQFSKDHVQKIESLKCISKERQKEKEKNKDIEKDSKSREQQKEKERQRQKQKDKNKIGQNKAVGFENKVPPVPETKPVATKVRKQEPKKQQKNQNRSNSYKKPMRNPNFNKAQGPKSNNQSGLENGLGQGNKNKVNTWQLKEQGNEVEEEIEEDGKIKDKSKKKFKDDINAMKETMRGNNRQEYFQFQQKISNILEEQEEVFATHMTVIKEDAKLLAQESQLISQMQGVGFIDYDIDSYVEKIQGIIKKKLKMYNLMGKKLENFKQYLKEEEEIRHQVKDVPYF